MKAILNSFLLVSVAYAALPLSAAEDTPGGAGEPAPASVAELLTALKLTEAQKAGFQAQEQFRIKSQAEFKQLEGKALKVARDAFYADRRAALQKLFSEEQWALWTAYWNGRRNAPKATPNNKRPSAVPSAASAKHGVPDLLGKKGFVHVERQNGIWFMINAEGERFVPTGMNHVGPMHRFARYNRDHWIKEIGGGIMERGRVNFQSPGAKKWLELIAGDHRTWGFNTLAFHHPHPMPTEYCNELGLHYFGKVRMSHVHAKRAKTMSKDKRLPDVFDPAWVQELDAFVARYTAKHKESKYLLGYSYDDLPAYTIHNLERPIRRFEHHPWIMDILSRPGETRGKKQWVDVLKGRYDSPAEAAGMYGLKAETWEDLLRVEKWGLPVDEKKGFADQALMNARIVEAHLKAYHDAIRKHDPNHLILGDKIQNARAQPDWVWAIVKKYVDVVLIQDYDFFTPAHEKKLQHIHEMTEKPIINGDHSYGAVRPHMDKVKGVPVPTMEDKGKQYAIYLKGIMNLPFMVGWQTCGYLETWAGTSDATGKCQTGYFDPMGKPIVEALQHVKAANEKALSWHQQAGELGGVYSSMKRTWEQPKASQQAAPAKPPLYSDFTQVRGKATDHIHIEQIAGRRWFIDANGYAFFPVGMSHTQFFENTVELVNVGDAYACACHAFTILADLNVNACASLSRPQQKKAALERRFAYCKSIFPMITPHSSTYRKRDYHRADPFSEEFEKSVDEKIRSSTRGNASDPHIMGFSYGFNPFQLMHKWINHFLASPADSPAKRAIVDQVYRKSYDDVAAFNAVYGTAFDGFDEIPGAASIQYDASLDPRPDEVVTEGDLIKRDFNRITCLLIAKVHQVAHDRMRHYAPEKLILGYFFKPYNFNLDMYEAIAPYVDVLSPQHLHIIAYKNGVYNRERGVLPVEKIHARTGKPIYISDMALGKVYSKNNKPTEHSVYSCYNTQADRGKVYYAAVKKAAALPQVVGFSGCMTIYDNPTEKGQHGGNKGYISPFTGKEKTEFTEHVRSTNSQIYDVRMGENDIEELTDALIDAMHDAIH